jgi:uncharacterized protein (DUF885 family)
MRKKWIAIAIIIFNSSFLYSRNNKEFDRFVNQFCQEVQAIPIPGLVYDYRDYFASVPSLESINTQEIFFKKERTNLFLFDPAQLSLDERIIYDHLLYEIDLNLERLALEKKWVMEGRKIPSWGLSEITEHRQWYVFFIKKFTGLRLAPEEIMEFGKMEVKKVQNEILKIQLTLGFSNEEDFYAHLTSSQFYITDPSIILREFKKTDSTIRANLKGFTGKIKINQLYPIEWADAGPYTPPGMYLNASNNSYGKDVFLYNFYGGKYNSRCIDWLFMHEGIPGHHLQASIRKQLKTDSLQLLFTYPGNFEGWACYVEYEGKQLGVYSDKYRELGKWEWDLIRSARVVMEVGIHYYGWTHQEAMDYWKLNIKGQDEIAEREITRITNWPGQALSYKIGAATIFQLKEETKQEFGARYSESKFNQCYLSFGMRPLEVIKTHFKNVYQTM